MTQHLIPPNDYVMVQQQALASTCTVDGLDIQLYQWGQSEPCVVLLHGGYGSWAHWIRVIPKLQAYATVIAPDMPGFGQSDSPPEPQSAESVARPLAEAIRQQVGDRTLILAGFSFGGAIAGHTRVHIHIVPAVGICGTRIDSGDRGARDERPGACPLCSLPCEPLPQRSQGLGRSHTT